MPQGPDATDGSLSLRVLSALILAPPVLAAVYLGWPYFEVLMVAVTVLLAREWDRLCGGGVAASGVVLAAVAVAAVALAAYGRFAYGAAVVGIGFGLVYAVARALGRENTVWIAGGAAYIGVPLLAAVWLRTVPVEGAEILLWLIAVVAVSDVGAYFVGRGVGGPKLAPRISPNKTWSGLVGGMLAAGLVGAAGAWIADVTDPGAGAALGMAAAAVSQIGDLFESASKRRFGVKDAGGIIPGHGGLLDRVDGHLTAVPALAAMVWWSGGQMPGWR